MRSVEEMRRLSALLDEALDREPSERDGWLDALPADPDDLKPALRSLLARASHETASLLDRGPAFLPPAAGPAAGAPVGPYRLLRELGSGGMGSVWLAERADGPVRRQVALKLPHAGWSPAMAERFERECGILASLEHPNIARLYDAGADADGRPYMALEYVEGRPIDAYCRERGLGVPERLALLLQVADAVAFAHGRLVLHRDLKPGNILVTADGQVRLLDFGIAKLMDDGQAAETALTRAAGRALTLDYASPEQIRGEPLGTASDVYSLGVVAFELLAGARPYRLKRGSAAELEEAITGQDIPAASDVATDRAAAKALAGDLDAILNKALKKQVTDRYPTVDALAQDWRDHLQGRRVGARPDTLLYRASRLVQRYRGPLAAAVLGLAAFVLAIGFGATAVVVGALLLGLGAALLLARRAAAERDRALELADRNAAVNTFLETLMVHAAPAGALTAHQLLERSERLIDHEIRGNTAHRAYVLGVLSQCYSGLEEVGHAAALLERALEAARGASDRELVDSLAGRHAVARGRLGHLDEAVAALDALLARADASPDLRAELHSHRSVLASWVGDADGTLAHAHEALRWHRRARHPRARDEIKLLSDLGWAYMMRGRGTEADRHLAEALGVSERLGIVDSPRTTTLLADWGLVRQERGDLPRSLALFDRGLEIAQRISPDTPPSVFLVANRAYTLTHMGRYAEADAGYRLALEIARARIGPAMVHSIRMCRIELLAEQGRRADAERELAEAQAELHAGSTGESDGSAGQFARLLAQARIALLRDEPATAVAVYTEALDHPRPSGGTANALLGRASAYLAAGQLEAAGADARAALAMARQLQGELPASFRTGLACVLFARLERQQGDAEAARRYARDALPQLVPTLEAGHAAIAEARALAAG